MYVKDCGKGKTVDSDDDDDNDKIVYMAIGKHLHHSTLYGVRWIGYVHCLSSTGRNRCHVKECVEMNLISKLNKYKVYATNQLGGFVNLT